jgi:hypothetical protein
MLVAARETIPRRIKAEGIAIVWDRLEHYELKRRERGTGREPRPRPMPSLLAGTLA